MTSAIRWRIVVLQVAMIAVFAFAAGFLFWAGNFTHSYVHDELVAQKIVFPPANSPAIKALPAADASAMRAYAGQPLDSGVKAEVYANHFIKVHLGEMGMTYLQASAKAMAQPKNAQLQTLVATLFKGETLRGLLLNSWGWWTIGTYAFYAAIGMTVATLAVLGALIFEVALARRKNEAVLPHPARPRAAGVTA